MPLRTTISRRSLNELRDAFRGAQLKRYVTPADYEPIERLPLAVTQSVIRPDVSCSIIKNSGQARVQRDRPRLARLALVDQDRPVAILQVDPLAELRQENHREFQPLRMVNAHDAHDFRLS